jgi:TonB family protein
MSSYHSFKLRANVSFAVSIAVHAVFLILLSILTIKDQREAKRIDNVEFVEVTKPNEPPGPPKEAPKNLWEFMKMAIPTMKKSEVPDIKKEEKPMELIKKEITKTLEVERKLIDKQDPLLKKKDSLEFKEINKDKDQALKDLMKMTKGDTSKIKELIEQEKLIDRSAPMQKNEDKLEINEVGRKKYDNPQDIVKIEKEQAGRQKNLTLEDLLTDRKAPVEKKPQVNTFGIKLKSMDDSQVRDIKKPVIGTDEERKRAREYLAASQKLQEREPPKTVSAGGGGKPQIGFSSGVKLKKDEELKKVEKPVIDTAKRPPNAVEETIKLPAAKGSGVEITGPLKDRKILASYMPKYPEWMKEKGIAADVSVYFKVSPSGNVREEMSIERTSSYTELDKLVVAALRQWQFAPLDKSVKQEDQYGIVTFRFRLQ